MLVGITLAGGEADRQRELDVGELRFRQIDFSRLGAFLEMVGGAAAGNRHETFGAWASVQAIANVAGFTPEFWRA